MKGLYQSSLFPCWQRFAVLAAFVAAVSLFPAAALEWSRSGIAEEEYWRLLTGHWVHLGMSHLALNLAGLLVTGLLFTQHPPLSWWTSYLILSPLVISVGLLLTAPDLDWYRGFSGCLHGLLVFTAVFNIKTDTRWSIVVLTFLAVKLVSENMLFPVTGLNPLIGGAVVTQSHWLGALTGLAAGLLLWWRVPSGAGLRE